MTQKQIKTHIYDLTITFASLYSYSILYRNILYGPKHYWHSSGEHKGPACHAELLRLLRWLWPRRSFFEKWSAPLKSYLKVFSSEGSQLTHYVSYIFFIGLFKCQPAILWNSLMTLCILLTKTIQIHYQDKTTFTAPTLGQIGCSPIHQLLSHRDLNLGWERKIEPRVHRCRPVHWSSRSLMSDPRICPYRRMHLG